ncbi:MAG: hypothetical protein KJN79_10230 [Gammaproteobacteria bacterium]|jgi:hypothetical protein|nr:hypothetical protein [Gammaproteobacteria bacterium]
MLTDKKVDEVAPVVTDELEVDAFVAPSNRAHHDRYARHTHELPEESSEATSRALIRVVPLVYAVLLGGLADSLLLGLSAGVILSAAFDLSMGAKSLVLSLLRRRSWVHAALSRRRT